MIKISNKFDKRSFDENDFRKFLTENAEKLIKADRDHFVKHYMCEGTANKKPLKIMMPFVE
jgi:hypothetical protein